NSESNQMQQRRMEFTEISSQFGNNRALSDTISTTITEDQAIRKLPMFALGTSEWQFRALPGTFDGASWEEPEQLSVEDTWDEDGSPALPTRIELMVVYAGGRPYVVQRRVRADPLMEGLVLHPLEVLPTILPFALELAVFTANGGDGLNIRLNRIGNSSPAYPFAKQEAAARFLIRTSFFLVYDLICSPPAPQSITTLLRILPVVSHLSSSSTVRQWRAAPPSTGLMDWEQPNTEAQGGLTNSPHLPLPRPQHYSSPLSLASYRLLGPT
ncbi:3176_t:CDS:2, partial [Acaulospora colombiana]